MFLIKIKQKLWNIQKNLNAKLLKMKKNFFSKDFDFCYISTPSGSHYNDIRKCFKYNKHVVVEKPPTLKIRQLLFLNKIAIRKNYIFL